MVPLLPQFPRLLHTTPENASWMITAALLAGAAGTPVVTRLADMYGKRRMIAVCLVVMVAGSLLGALGTGLVTAVAARALQGVGVALVPVGIAAMRDALPPDRVPLGVAVMSATLAVGAGAGLPLAGLVAAHLDWHAIFWGTALAGVLMLVVLLLVVPGEPGPGGSFDLPGAVVLSVGLTAALLALTKGNEWGWASAATLGCALGGVLALVGVVLLELRTRAPLVDVRVAARPAVLSVNIASLVLGFAMFANLLVSTQQLVLPVETGFGLGLDAATAGLWLAPSALTFAIMAPPAARLITRIGPERTLLLGAAVMTAAYVVRILAGYSIAAVVVGSVLVAGATSLTFAAMPTLIMRAVPRTETASANGLNTLDRSVGTSGSSATTAAVTSASVVLVGGVPYPTASGLALVLGIAATGAAIAAGIALLLARLPTPVPEPS
jgi:MFS family permease